MRCRKVRKSLLEYDGGALSEKMQREIEAHLDGCPDCAALAARLELSREALSPLEPVAIPEDASGRILASIRRAAPRRRSLLQLLRSPRAVAVGAVAAAVLIAAVVVVGLRTGGGPTTVTKTKSPDLSAPASETERLEQSTASGLTTGEGVGVLPLVKFTTNDYTPDSLRLASDNLQVKKDFANAYTMSDSINLAGAFKRKAADDFANLGGDAPLLEAMFAYITSGEPTLLPCYVERARFQGKDCWIILLVGPPRSGGSVKLTRSEVWVMDPVKFAGNPDAGVVFFLEQK
jgi:hypothetical protein